MASVNKVIIVGNLGRDPEVKYNPQGVAWCTLSVATTRKWKNRESGELQEETEWHRTVLNDKLAENAGKYLKKGSPVYLEGRLKTRKWADKEGKDTYTTEIIVDQMQFLGGKPDGEGGQGGGGQQRSANAGYGQRAPSPAPKSSGGGFSDMDDDIPFHMVGYGRAWAVV